MIKLWHNIIQFQQKVMGNLVQHAKGKKVEIVVKWLYVYSIIWLLQFLCNFKPVINFSKTIEKSCAIMEQF